MSYDANRPEEFPADDAENQEPQLVPSHPSSLPGLIFAFMIFAVFLVIVLPMNIGGHPATRSSHEEQAARQRLVDEQIAQVNALLAADAK